MSMRPASSSVSIGDSPLNGTCSMSMPALVLNSSPARCAPEPLPVEPNVRLPGLAFAIVTMSSHARRREVLAHHQDVRHGGDAGDRREILHRVVGAVLDQALIGGVGLVGAEHQRVAVGLGARHRVGADDARSARTILDHDGLAEIGRRLLGDHPCQRVDRTARRVGHNDRDGSARKALGARGGREPERGEPGEDTAARKHDMTRLHELCISTAAATLYVAGRGPVKSSHCRSFAGRTPALATCDSSPNRPDICGARLAPAGGRP